MSDRTRTAIVSFLIIIGFLGFCYGFGYLVLTDRIKPDLSVGMAILLGTVFGVLTSGFCLALGYELGSSAGSRIKDAIIAGQIRSPATPVPSPPVSVPPLVPQPQPPPPKPLPEPAPKPAPLPAVNVMTFTGRMSTFGGPNDLGMADDEGLALCEPAEVGKFPGLFLPAQPLGPIGLGRRLDPNKPYLACRWNYKRTPRSWLQGEMAKVSANGKMFQAQPIDWGPAESTGRIADLSPGLATALGLKTDDVVTVEMPLPPGSPAVEPTPTDVIPHLKVLTNEELDAQFGPFPYTEGPGGTIVPDPAWVAANIQSVTIPQLAHLVPGGTIQCHKAAVAPLQAVFAELESLGLMADVLTFDGLWVPRHIASDPHRGISRHSRGLALDLNAEWNPYGSRGAAPGAKGSCWRLAPVFEKYRFAWGAWFGRSSLDGPPASDTDSMHFELT